MPTALGASSATLNGLNLHQTEDNGVEWVLDDIAGWGSPASTYTAQQRPRSHGAWSGEAWLRPRTLALSGHVYSPSPAALSDAVDRLNDAVSLDPVLLQVSEAGRVRSMLVRRSDDVLVHAVSDTAWAWSIQVTADDPRKYGTQVSVSTALPSASGGLTFPVTFPVTFTGVTVTGLVSIVNQGNLSAPVVVRFDGPVVGPKVVHVQTQKAWAAAGAVLGAGEFWTVDMASRQVMAQGQSSRSGYVTERGWFELLPGPNDFAFSADTYNAGALMTVTAASAWK